MFEVTNKRNMAIPSAVIAAVVMLCAAVLVCSPMSDATGEDLEGYGNVNEIAIAPGYSWSYTATFPSDLEAGTVLSFQVNELNTNASITGHNVSVIIPTDFEPGAYNLVLKAEHADSGQVAYQWIRITVNAALARRGYAPRTQEEVRLFVGNGVAKLKEGTGRMAIIQNGSSLFTGDAGSGPSEIRRHLIENDWLDAIVQLPNDSFYNTGIATYVWIVTKGKPESHKGKVLLIDASQCFEPRRKSIGNKRVDITDACRALIVRAYGEYVTEDYRETLDNGREIVCRARLMDNDDFGYSKITVETPMVDENGRKVLKKGKPVADTDRRDTENVPLAEDIDAYLAREVLPYNPGAWIDGTKTKVGYEIPFTRVFYVYKELEKAADIAERIKAHEKSLMDRLDTLFGEEA